jgi:hypothetical protein
LPYPPGSEAEEIAFPAVKAEDDGDVAEARKLWEQLKTARGGWGVVAQGHLEQFAALTRTEAEFQRLHDRIAETGADQAPEWAEARKAYLAWRAEKFGDRRLAQALIQSLKEETSPDGEQHFWHLFATWKSRKLAADLAESPQDRKGAEESAGKKLEKAQEQVAKGQNWGGPLTICLDIIALYHKDEALNSLVEDARKLRAEIDRRRGTPPP